jgi:alpha-L-rhamnosidase
MGGPIFGASGKINLAFCDALRSMSKMCSAVGVKDTFSSRADLLKDSILSHLWNDEAGVMRMSDISSPTGICQDINAYSITTGIAPPHSKSTAALAAPKDSTLPLAFLGIDRWDQMKVVSPYASGFAVEALFERSYGDKAIELLERVWGIMADETNPNYSGGHWEALKPDGTPITDDTSLMHGWSTWPVYLLPRYLGGVQPLEAGWSSFTVKPVLAGLDTVDIKLSTPEGEIGVHLDIQERLGTGDIKVMAPPRSIANVFAPEGWIIVPSVKDAEPDAPSQVIAGQEAEVFIRIRRVSESLDTSHSSLAGRPKPAKKSVSFADAEETESTPGYGDPKLARSSFKQSNILKRLHRWLT